MVPRCRGSTEVPRNTTPFWLRLWLFSRYWAPISVLGSRVWRFWATWRHRSRDHLIPRRPFSIGVIVIHYWNQASVSNGFRDIQWRIWRNGWHDSVMLSPWGQAGLEAKFLSSASDSASKNYPRPRCPALSSVCPRTFYFSLVKMSVMMELVIIVSLQWLSTKVIY